MRLRGSMCGRGAKLMLGEPVRDGRVRFEADERRMLGHGLGVVLDAALEAVLSLGASSGTLAVVPVLSLAEVLRLALLSSEPEVRAESRTACMSAVKESSDEGPEAGGRGSASIVAVSDIWH